MGRVVLGCALLVTVLVYAPVQHAGRVYEDRRDGSLALSAPLENWAPLLPPRFRMLTALSFRAQATVGDDVPEFHLGNLLVHLVNGGLLYATAVTVVSPVAAGVAAAVWLLHPLQVESVAYLGGRADLLLVTSVLLMLLAAEHGSLLGAFAAGLLAMAAKETGIVVLGLLPLWLSWRDRWAPRWLLPMLAWAVIGGMGAIGLMRGGFVDGQRVWHMIARYTVPAPHGPFWFAAVQAAAVFRMAALVVVPVGFTVDHDWDLVSPGLALVALLALVSAVIWAWRRFPASGAFAVLWVVAALLPRFLVPLPDYVNEHQIVIALIGPCLALACGLERWIDERAVPVSGVSAASASVGWPPLHRHV